MGRGRQAASWSWVVVQKGWAGLGWAGLEGTCHFCLWLKKPGEEKDRSRVSLEWDGFGLVTASRGVSLLSNMAVSSGLPLFSVLVG